MSAPWHPDDERAARVLAVRYLWAGIAGPITVSEHDIEMAGRDNRTRQLRDVARAAIEGERKRQATDLATAREAGIRQGEASMRTRAAEAVQARAALMRDAADEHQEKAAQTAWELRMVAGKLDSVAADLAALPLTGEGGPLPLSKPDAGAWRKCRGCGGEFSGGAPGDLCGSCRPFATSVADWVQRVASGER